MASPLNTLAVQPTATMFVGPAVSNALREAVNSNTQLAPASRIMVAGWIGGPKTRGSWSLMYSCVFTIGLCIWTAIHPNIPGPTDGRWMVIARKVKWALCALIAPEFVLAVASQQLYRAWRLRRALRAIKSPKKELIGSLAAAEAVEERKKVRRTRVGKRPSNDFGMTYCFYVVMGGFTTDISSLRRTGIVTLTDEAVRRLAERGHFLNISTAGIMDKSKADILAKSLAVFQVSWLIVQSIARAVEGLPLTLLEIHSMSHVAVALVVYLFWWCKPKDIARPTAVDAEALGSDLEEILVEHTEQDFQQGRWFHVRALAGRMSNFYTSQDSDAQEEVALLAGPMVLAALYSAVHLTATQQWGAHTDYFPTQIEATLWLSAGYIILGTSGLALLGLALVFIWIRMDDRLWNMDDEMELPFFVRVMFAYKLAIPLFLLIPLLFILVITSRVYLIVESFISLRVVPLEVYLLPDWTLYIPHF